MLTFNSIDDCPSLETIIKELITNPTFDHTWYKLIQMYESFSD